MQGDEAAPKPTSRPLTARVQARLQEHARVVHSLLETDEQLAGSVFARWSACNKPGCSCAQGRRHGPYYVLAVGSGPRRAWTPLEGAALPEARRLVKQHREYRRGLHRLAALHKLLAGLLRQHAAQAARRAERRLVSSRRERPE
jgi:hypothetical protein